MNPIRVVHLSTSDSSGGAALCAARLHLSMESAGVDSRMLIARRYGGVHGTVEYNPIAPAPPALGRLAYRVAKRMIQLPPQRRGAFFTFDRMPLGLRLLAQLPACDLVNLHWVAGMLDFRLLPRLTECLPVVWTFHDINAFTGGCHYSDGCDRFTASCGRCPLMNGTPSEEDLTRRSFERKRAALEAVDPSRLTVVTPSRWMAGEAGRSALFGRFERLIIPSGIDCRQFRPVDRTIARRRFDLPEEARIVLFVAEQLTDRRKGLSVLFSALAGAREMDDLLFVAIGRGQGIESALPAGNVRHLGSLREAADLRAVYSAADAFVIPSLEDNFPNTVLEAMACGTPVVGFACGGIPEAVIDGQTGLLAPTGDGPALIRLLRRAMDDEALRTEMGRRARAVVERDYSLELHGRRYAELYARILAGGPAEAGGRAAKGGGLSGASGVAVLPGRAAREGGPAPSGRASIAGVFHPCPPPSASC